MLKIGARRVDSVRAELVRSCGGCCLNGLVGEVGWPGERVRQLREVEKGSVSSQCESCAIVRSGGHLGGGEATQPDAGLLLWSPNLCHPDAPRTLAHAAVHRMPRIAPCSFHFGLLAASACGSLRRPRGRRGAVHALARVLRLVRVHVRSRSLLAVGHGIEFPHFRLSVIDQRDPDEVPLELDQFSAALELNDRYLTTFAFERGLGPSRVGVDEALQQHAFVPMPGVIGVLLLSTM